MWLEPRKGATTGSIEAGVEVGAAAVAIKTSSNLKTYYQVSIAICGSKRALGRK
jgi:hypothetical protein